VFDKNRTYYQENNMSHTEQTQERERQQPKDKPVAVTVNHKEVKLPDHKTTGKAIKQAAIDQMLAIQIDFPLFAITGSTQRPVGDAEEITVHDGQAFRAVNPDDNS
jgi:hypothetical protein